MAKSKIEKKYARRSVRKTDVRNFQRFKKIVLEYYRKSGRHYLPWRKTTNPYRILVSEIMLQQTQATRVVPKYEAFLKRFPTVRALAKAPLGDVLSVWQGLGYNRRAKMLHDAAQTTMIYHSGKIPREYETLVALPGVGDYTAKAVRVFAYNEPEILIETNVRSVFIHHFFPRSRSVSDKNLLPLIEHSVRCLDIAQKGIAQNREWYSALMDYGSYLKKSVPNPSRKSTHHTKQKAFKGSDREIRGAVLRAALNGHALSSLPFPKDRIAKQRKALKKEGLI